MTTFKHHLVTQLDKLADHEDDKDATEVINSTDVDLHKVVRELWGPGGPLAELVTKSSTRGQVAASSAKGLVNEWYESAVAAAVIAFLPPSECHSIAEQHNYSAPANLSACFESLQREGGARFDLIKKRRLWADSFVLQCDSEVWGDKACEPLVTLLEQLNSWRKAAPEWLESFLPLRSYQHGDLNAANVLIDLRGSLWLIDFASTGPDKNPFVDAAKMVAALLFEYYPVPLSVQEARQASVQKLRDAFGIPSDELAVALKEAWKECNTKSEMVLAARRCSSTRPCTSMRRSSSVSSVRLRMKRLVRSA